jgi:hypothetical protein
MILRPLPIVKGGKVNHRSLGVDCLENVVTRVLQDPLPRDLLAVGVRPPLELDVTING